jgi:serine/threonine protein kinase
MELIMGETIVELLSRLGRDATNVNYNLQLRWIIIGRILEAIAYVHSQGIHHRDITQNNVMWNGKYIVFIDFGFSCNSLTNDCTKTRMRYFGGESVELYYTTQLIHDIAFINIPSSIWDSISATKINRITSAWSKGSRGNKIIYDAVLPESSLSDLIEIYNGTK